MPDSAGAAAPSAAKAKLARIGDERVRALLAAKLASLLPGLPTGDRDRVREKVLTALAELVEDEAVSVRAAIADVVKDMPAAPRELILRLAYDTVIEVSEPVIRLSPLLTTEDLLALLVAAPTPATVTAVARRPGLPEAVADAVAASADTPAITVLLRNLTATIREATLDALIAGAAGVLEWHEPLVRRKRLTTQAVRALAAIVTTHLLDELASRADLEPAVLGELRHRLAQRAQMATPTEDDGITAEQALETAREIFASGALNDAAMLGAVHRGEARLATAMLAVAASVPTAAVDRAATLRSAKALVSLVWRAGLSMHVAGPLQTLLGRLPPEIILRAGAGGGFPLEVDEMRWQIAFLTRSGR